MSGVTGIEWTDRVWNPITGCQKVSPGCKHCYAETVAHRFWETQYVHTVERGFIPVKAYAGDAMTGTPRKFTDVMCHEDRLLKPLSWRTGARVFVNSMSDLFHEDVPDAFIDRVFAVMAIASRHTFQVLTKRPERMRAYFQSFTQPDAFRRGWNLAAWVDSIGHNDHLEAIEAIQRGLPNVWLGVSVEDQQRADERIPLLLETPAAVRFISAEPLLGPVDLRGLVYYPGHSLDAFTGTATAIDDGVFLGHPFGPPNVDQGIDWVIVGGESGHSARVCEIQWIRQIVRQCREAGTPCFVKQLGRNPLDRVPVRDIVEALAAVGAFLEDPKGGDPAEWPEDLRVREFPR